MLALRKAMMGFLPGLMLAACTTQAEEPATSSQDRLVMGYNDDGAVTNVSRVVDTEQSASPRTAESRDALAAPQASLLTSGCTHIRFCTPVVICDTNDKTTGACTPNARLNECFSDADFVCGKDWTQMKFDPPIQF